MNDLIENCVKPIYHAVLHGNFLKDQDPQFIEDSKMIAHCIKDEEIDSLLNMGWREAISASWIVAITKNRNHIIRLEQNLIPSRWCFSGQFHLIALGRLEENLIVQKYLKTYLPVEDKQYDQDWAFGVLNHLGCNMTPQFDNDELWQMRGFGDNYYLMDRKRGIRKVKKL